nr:anthrone oxygenase family protein [Micromonospora sp. DSM 115978]
MTAVGLRIAVLVAATVCIGLIAGLLAAFAYAVMPGLARTDDRTFVTAMARINESIINGWFAVIFGGAIVFTAGGVLSHLWADNPAALFWTVAALGLYLVALVITGVVNVPLNNRLLADEQTVDPATIRRRFEPRWVRWNVARAFAATAAFACLCLALVQAGGT